jgi:hypothetical protein
LPDIHHLVMKYTGIEQLVDELVQRIGNLKQVYITDDFAAGKPGNILDLLLVGGPLDEAYLNQLIKKAEGTVHFKIRYITVLEEEVSRYLPDQTSSLLVWSKD